MTRPLAVVIGAAGGIGAATAEALAAQGSQVWACDIRDTSPILPGLPGEGHRPVGLDVTDPDAIDALIAQAWQTDALTAIAYTPGLLTSAAVADTDPLTVQRVLAVNLLGAFHLGRAVQLKLRAQRRRLAMIFLSSTAGLRGEGGGALYCASKFGLIGFAQSFAADVAEYGARVNAVCPGNVDTPMLRDLAELTAQRGGASVGQTLEGLRNASAFRRLITPQEVAQVCAWLLSDASSGVSGQAIVVDGPPPLNA